MQNNYIDIVKLLLDFPNIDVNIKSFITVEYHNDSPEFENEPDHVKTLNFEPQMVHTLTINTKNPNDEEDTWPIIRKIEMFQPNKDVGVFTQLIQNSEHHDPHRIGVFISATCFDTNHFFRIQPDEVYKYHVITHNDCASSEKIRFVNINPVDLVKKLKEKFNQ